MMWRWDGTGGWWMMGIGWLLWIIIVVAVVWLIVRLLNARAVSNGPDSAREVLRRRFAAGEIDAEEYERTLAVLRKR